MKRIAALVLALCSMLSMMALPVHAVASDDPLAKKDYDTFGSAAAETTVPAEATQPEIQPAETAPKTDNGEQDDSDKPDSSAETEAPETQPTEAPSQCGSDAKEDKTDGTTDRVPEMVKPRYDPSASQSANADPNAPKGHCGIPLYFQNDYPDEVYGEGTVASNGCSAASLAMVATYLTERVYTPDEIARYFGDSAENNIVRLENGSDIMKLPYRKSGNWHETYAALKAGKVIIALMNSKSLFTNSQHFIILTGLNEDGKIMVNDSQKANYDKWDIQRGLREGFDEGDIMLGYEGAWIYDKEAMPKEPFLYYEPEPVRGECRYDFGLAEDEKWFIAKVVWVEARGESREGQQAVAEVILNRLASEKFPNTLSGVVYAAGQFKSAKFLDKAKPNQMQYEAVENALLGPYVLPEDVFYFATTPKTSRVWGEIGGHVFCYADY